MRIVVLDGYTLNPGDLSWRTLKSLDQCIIYDRTPPEEVVPRLTGCQIALTNKTVIAGDAMAQLPDLRYIGVLATGYNVVDISVATQRDITVTNVPSYGTASVAQMVFSHLLNLCHHVAQHSESVCRGVWSRSEDFCFWDYPLVELSGLAIGIVGFGQIGAAVAQVASAFGMDVLVCDPLRSSIPQQFTALPDIETLFQKSDVVSLHCPLTEQNRGFVNAHLLSLMKETAFFINTSRGPLVDEVALADVLNRGAIAGAGLDVLTEEPPTRECPLLTARNCFITPHIAWATRAARERLMHTAVENVKAFMRGEKLNVVNCF